MPVNRQRRWPNTNLSPGLLYTLRKHVAFNQCSFNVDPQLTHSLYYAGDALTSRRQKQQIQLIHWPNADVMLGHRLRRWANIIPTKTL